MVKKCEKCGKKIIGKPSYICNEETNNKNLKVCQFCFQKLKSGKRNGKTTEKEYMGWLKK